MRYYHSLDSAGAFYLVHLCAIIKSVHVMIAHTNTYTHAHTRAFSFESLNFGDVRVVCQCGIRVSDSEVRDSDDSYIHTQNEGNHAFTHIRCLALNSKSLLHTHHFTTVTILATITKMLLLPSHAHTTTLNIIATTTTTIHYRTQGVRSRYTVASHIALQQPPTRAQAVVLRHLELVRLGEQFHWMTVALDDIGVHECPFWGCLLMW